MTTDKKEKMACPKCETPQTYTDAHRDVPCLCLKCGNLMKRRASVFISLTDEELAAIPEGEMAIYDSMRKAFTEPEPPYYENTAKE